MKNKKGVLAVGTVIVVLNIVLAMMSVVFIEMMLGQYNLQQKMVIISQGERLRCSAIIREAIGDEYSKKDETPVFLPAIQLTNFYGEPEENFPMMDYESIDVQVCGTEGTPCNLDSSKQQVIYCEAPTYHPRFSNTKKTVIVQKDTTT